MAYLHRVGKYVREESNSASWQLNQSVLCMAITSRQAHIPKPTHMPATLAPHDLRFGRFSILRLFVLAVRKEGQCRSTLLCCWRRACGWTRACTCVGCSQRRTQGQDWYCATPTYTAHEPAGVQMTTHIDVQKHGLTLRKDCEYSCKITVASAKFCSRMSYIRDR